MRIKGIDCSHKSENVLKVWILRLYLWNNMLDWKDSRTYVLEGKRKVEFGVRKTYMLMAEFFHLLVNLGVLFIVLSFNFLMG